MSRKKYFMRNFNISTIGQVIPKIIGFLMVYFYTRVLSPSEFGIIGIINTTILLVLPLISFQIYEGVFRFIIDGDDDKNKILVTTIKFLTITFTFFSIPIYLIITRITQIDIITLTIYYLILFFRMYKLLYISYYRGLNDLKKIAISGILESIITASSSLLFIWYIKLGILGFFYACLLGIIISLIYLIVSNLEILRFKLTGIDYGLIIKMLKFSLPLLPNALMWWVLNVSDRYMITIYNGLDANGIYSISSQFPGILFLFNASYYSAWQISSIKEFKTKSSKLFYSKVVNNYISFYCIIICLLLIILKPFYKVFINNEFYIATDYIPFLLIGTMFAGLTSIYGMGYIISKKTKGATISTLIGAVLNIIINIILLPIIGVQAASLSTLISFIIVFVYRIIDTKNKIKIYIDFPKMIVNLIIISIQVIIYFNYKLFNVKIIIMMILISILSLWINKNLLKEIYKWKN